MPSLSRKCLVGEKFKLSIGEPWDFISEVGKNKLVGRVLAVSEFNSEKDWILLEVSHFSHEEKIIERVVGVNRYMSSQDVFGNIGIGADVVLNFMYLTNGSELNPDTLLNELKDESQFSFLIGSLSRKK